MATWMVVEDEQDLYEVLIAMFGAWHVDGVAFADGSEATAWIDAVDHGHISGELPSLALLDIRLPVGSGPEVAARIRRSPRLNNIAIVLMTAYRLDNDKHREIMSQSQADLLINKPLPDMAALRKILEAQINLRNQPQT